MATFGPQQNLSGVSIPVIARDAPPEGTAVVPYTFALAGTNYAQSTTLNFSTLGITQVRSIYVDNTQNVQAATIIHGAALQTTVVPAGGGGFIGTTSTQGNYFLSVSVPMAPTNTTNVNLTLYNYEIAPSLFGNTIVTTTNTVNTSALDNPFHNAGCVIAQRGTAGLAVATGTSAYTLDGWLVSNTGAGVTGSQAAGIGVAAKSLQIAGAASNTNVKIFRRVEAAISAPLANNTMVLQFKIANASGGAIVPIVTMALPTAADNFGALAAFFFSGNMQSCPNAATTQCAYVLNMPASMVTGLQVQIDVGALGAGASVSISDIDLSVASPGTNVGLLQTVPPPRLRNIGEEMIQCSRYFSWAPMNFFFPNAPAAATFYGQNANWATMRAVPTIGAMVADPATTQSLINVQSQNITQATLNGGYMTISSNAAGNVALYGYRRSVSAEL